MINIYFSLVLKISNTVARYYKINCRTERAKTVVQSAFAKIRYYKDKVASCEFSSYSS